MNNNSIDIFSLLNCIQDESVNIFKEVTVVNFQENEIYLGTTKGAIHKLDNQILDDDESSFVSSLLESLDVLQNHAVKEICVCKFLDLMAVLINETVLFITLRPLEIRSMNVRVKNVTMVSVTQGVSTKDSCITKMCVSVANKRLQIYLVEIDHLTLIKEIVIPAMPLALCLHHEVCCFASSQAYMIVNIANDRLTELFSFDAKKTRPKIASLPGAGEFLLSGPDGLAIFADVDGTSQKPPIQWSSLVQDFVVLKSAIVAIDKEFLTVHSIDGQSQVQTIYLPNQDCMLASSSSALLVITDRRSLKPNVTQLVPLSWNQQAHQYLSRNCPDMALRIANKQASRANYDHSSKEKCHRIFVVAGFHKFRERSFKEAKSLFERGRIDLRELIVCYQNLLPISYRFEPKVATPDSGYRLASLCLKSTEMTEYKQFLLEFLVEHRGSKLAMNISQIVEAALVKLFVELEPDKLFHNFTMMLADVDYDDLVDYLSSQGHHHACAMVMQWYGQIETAVDVWSRLARNEISDPLFPGMKHVMEVLSNVSDPKIIVKNIDWLLALDATCTSSILSQFISRLKNERDLIGYLVTDSFFKHLEPYPDSLFEVLFELCQNGLLESHSQNEYLSQVFIKKLSETRSSQDKFQCTRTQFCQFLSMSEEYPAKKLLKQVRDFPVPLLMEEALILGKLSEHQEALAIIVDQLHDLQFAEKYCFIFQRKCPDGNLFMNLLKVYLRNGDSRDKDEYTEAALHLLEAHTSAFNLSEVLSLLPCNWPLSRLREFLLKSFVLRQQTCFTMKMKFGLERAVNSRKLTEARATVQHNKLVIEEWKQLRCSHCGNNIDECSFIKTPGGQMLHKHCFNSV